MRKRRPKPDVTDSYMGRAWRHDGPEDMLVTRQQQPRTQGRASLRRRRTRRKP